MRALAYTGLVCVDDRGSMIEPVGCGECFERVRTNMLGRLTIPQVSTFIVSVNVGEIANGPHVFAD